MLFGGLNQYYCGSWEGFYKQKNSHCPFIPTEASFVRTTHIMSILVKACAQNLHRELNASGGGWEVKSKPKVTNMCSWEWA